MTDYTPDTATVRNAYTRALRQAFTASAGEHDEEFDRWLRKVQARAWSRGYQQGLRDEMTDVTHGADNPYLGGDDD